MRRYRHIIRQHDIAMIKEETDISIGDSEHLLRDLYVNSCIQNKIKENLKSTVKQDTNDLDVFLAMDARVKECVAIHPFSGQNGELTFHTGEIVMVTEELESGWWYGYHGNTQGWFPASYVEKRNTEGYTPLSLESDTGVRPIYSSLDLETQDLRTQSFLCRSGTGDSHEYHEISTPQSDDRRRRNILPYAAPRGELPDSDEAVYLSSVVSCIQRRICNRKAKRTLLDITEINRPIRSEDDGSISRSRSGLTRVSGPVLLSTTASIVRKSGVAPGKQKSASNCIVTESAKQTLQVSTAEIVKTTVSESWVKPEIQNRLVKHRTNHPAQLFTSTESKSTSQHTQHCTASTDTTAISNIKQLGQQQCRSIPPPRPPPPTKRSGTRALHKP